MTKGIPEVFLTIKKDLIKALPNQYIYCNDTLCTITVDNIINNCYNMRMVFELVPLLSKPRKL